MLYPIRMRIALSIAGFDPSGGAGLQADLKVFHAMGVHGLTVAAALTAQNTLGVTGIMPVARQFIEEELEALLSDMRPDALKTGMLFSREAIAAVAQAVKRHMLGNLVVDPVSVSSSGRSLLEEGALEALSASLFPLSRIITPNIYEASVLAGMSVESPEEMEAAARSLHRQTGPEAVIVTGGHLAGEAVDVLFDGKAVIRLEGKRVAGVFHGTGCAFSAALTALLAQGKEVVEAAREAKAFIEKAIINAVFPGKGMGVLRM